jgi:tetratricopeptide (TPR) repeat protein
MQNFFNKILYSFSFSHWIIGNDFYNARNYLEALKCYNEALKINPKYVEAYVSKGNALYGLEDYIGALNCYNEAITLQPDHDEAHYHKGLTLNGLAKLALLEKNLVSAEIKFNEAINCFAKVQGFDSNNASEKKQEAINLREEVRTALVIKFIEENPTNFYQDSYKLRLFESCKPIIQKYLTKQRESKEAFEDKQENSNIPGYKIWLIDFLSNVNYEKCIKSFENETKSRFFKVTGICKNIDEQYPALAMDNVRVIASFLSIADINLEDVNPDLLGENSTQITCITWPFEL